MTQLRCLGWQKVQVLALCIGITFSAQTVQACQGHDLETQKLVNFMLEPLRKLDSTFHKWRFSFLRNGQVMYEDSSDDGRPVSGLRYANHPIYGNHEVTTLVIPLPAGDAPRRVLLDEPIALTLHVDPNTTASLELEGESNVISRITPVLSDKGDLVFEFSHRVEAGEPVKAKLTLPLLEAFHHQSGSHVEISGVSGDRLRLLHTGRGSLNVSGAVQSLNAVVDRSEADLEELTVRQDLLLRADRGARVRLNAEGSVLQPSVFRSATACYVGEPAEIISVGSGASIKACPVPEEESEKAAETDSEGDGSDKTAEA